MRRSPPVQLIVPLATTHLPWGEQSNADPTSDRETAEAWQAPSRKVEHASDHSVNGPTAKAADDVGGTPFERERQAPRHLVGRTNDVLVAHVSGRPTPRRADVLDERPRCRGVR